MDATLFCTAPAMPWLQAADFLREQMKRVGSKGAKISRFLAFYKHVLHFFCAFEQIQQNMMQYPGPASSGPAGRFFSPTLGGQRRPSRCPAEATRKVFSLSSIGFSALLLFRRFFILGLTKAPFGEYVLSIFQSSQANPSFCWGKVGDALALLPWFERKFHGWTPKGLLEAFIAKDLI